MSGGIRIAATFALALSVASCDAPPDQKLGSDQKLRQELFQTCLRALPAGPQATRYNDWDEVVDSCASAAYYQSLICYENCPAGKDVLP